MTAGAHAQSADDAAPPTKPKTATAPAKPKSVAPTPPKPVTTSLPKPPVAAPSAPTQTFGPLNRTTIVLDPAHGGVDTGSRLTDNLAEKDVTLALAFKLRSLLNARGFTVVMVRDSDSATPANHPDSPLTLDDRAGLANHSRAVACLLLHATPSGTGVHLYSSELDPAPGEAATLPWLTAQAAWVPQSRSLEQKLSASLGRAGVPLVAASASVRPVDSLTCPALVVELAPATAGDANSISDSAYQQKVAEAIANAMVFWKTQAQPPARLDAPTPVVAKTEVQP